jgi:polysaccharide pyruvyl transferase WcaK-like protein
MEKKAEACKRILVAGAYGTGNLGDEAILSGLLTKLRKERNPRLTRIVVFSRAPRESASIHGVTARRRNLGDLVTCDEIIIGGGELFQDSNNMSIKYGLLGVVAKLLGKRVVFSSIGMSLMKKRFGRLVAKLSLRLADEVSVRDDASRRRLIDLGLDRPVVVVDDFSLSIDPAPLGSSLLLLRESDIKPYEYEKRIGLALRYTGNNELDRNLYGRLLRLLARILNDYPQVLIVFIPFCHHADSYLERDVALGEQLQKKLGLERFKIFRGRCTPREMMAIFTTFDLVISSRLHPLLFAEKMRVPKIGLDLYEKIRGCSERFNFTVVTADELEKTYPAIQEILAKKN